MLPHRLNSDTHPGAERASAVSGTLGTQQTNYVGSVQYWPHGAPYYYQYGNNVWPVNTFDSVLRPNQTYSTVGNNPNYWLLYITNAWNTNGTLGSLSEGYGPAVTWGNMIWANTSYQYDNVNRLSGATDSHWIRNFGYDQYGNMSVTGNFNVTLNGLTPVNQGSNPYNPANNRLLEGGYDAAGNMGTVGALSFWYDAEGRQTQSYDSGSHTTANYTYDADGQRVQKIVSNGATTIYIHDAFGQLAAEYASSAPTPPCTTCYLSYDHLGSVRLITDQNAQVVSRHDYLPFGEEIPNGTGGRTGNGFGAASNINQMFTGKERDGEMVPNFDYFGARYYSGALGRWAASDPSNLSVDFWIPQTWNRYSYALNNPSEMVDQNGLWPWPIHNQIISQAFPGMSADQLKALRDTSWDMDYGPGQQDASKSYQHGMSDGLTSQDPSTAEEEGNAFIAQNEQAAQKAQADWIASGHTGISPKALAAFGNALHTITDRTSPAHVGNQPWYGTTWWQIQSIVHYQQERKITPSQMQTAVGAARQAFRNTFGSEFHWMLLLMKGGGACVTVHDSASGTGFGGCQ